MPQQFPVFPYRFYHKSAVLSCVKVEGAKGLKLSTVKDAGDPHHLTVLVLGRNATEGILKSLL
jgi:hypothetical protein